MGEGNAEKRGSVLLLNQVVGPLFRELALDLAKELDAVTLATGRADVHSRELLSPVRLLEGPGYDRRTTLRRLTSWIRFLFFALRIALRSEQKTQLLIVSNPPFLPFVGWLMAKLRGQTYTILIYDLYPGMLENLGKIASGGVVSGIWRRFNRLTWAGAEQLIAIGEDMAANVRSDLASCRVRPPVHVIPNWVDTEVIRPRPKPENRFAAENGQLGKLTVLYAGNLGHSHDLGPVLDAAAALREDPRFSFMIVGNGPQRDVLAARVDREGLRNVRLLPFQPESVLPELLATGDVAVITYQKGTEGYMVPSKTYYAMAAGSALLVLASRENEVSRLIEEHECGTSVEISDRDTVVKALLRYAEDPVFLAKCRSRSREAAERHYNRKNTRAYAELLRSLPGRGRA